MSPAKDLVLWEFRWFVGDEELTGFCVLCNKEVKLQENGFGFSVADIIAAADHACPKADESLRHVLFRRSDGAKGEELKRGKVGRYP